MGRKGGYAKGEKARERAAQKLTLKRVQDDLGTLETIDDAQRWLQLIAGWTAANMISGTAGHVCVRSVEIWLRAHESKLTQAVVNDLRKEVDTLKGELKGKQLRAVR